MAGVAVDRGDGDDHVEDLFKAEVVADFVGVLCGVLERQAAAITRVRLFSTRGSPRMSGGGAPLLADGSRGTHQATPDTF